MERIKWVILSTVSISVGMLMFSSWRRTFKGKKKQERKKRIEGFRIAFFFNFKKSLMTQYPIDVLQSARM